MSNKGSKSPTTNLWEMDENGLAEYFSNLEKSLSYKFNDRKILLQAVTHSTFAYEKKNTKVNDNERLEFLGDCVLDLIAGDILFREPDCYPEGVMSKMRALVVCETTLSNIATDIGIGNYLQLGKGEELTNGRKKHSNLSNAMEAVIASVYLDGGYEMAYGLVKRLIYPFIQKAQKGKIVHDHKSKFLEYVQSIKKQDYIAIEIVKEEGPEHNRTFFAHVKYHDIIIGSGIGATKKEAEQEASREAYKRIKTVCESIDVFVEAKPD